MRRRIAAAFIILGVTATAGTALLIHAALVRIPRLNAQADEARGVQFHATNIARHLNFILAEAPEGLFVDGIELEHRLALIDSELAALARVRSVPATTVAPVREAAIRLKRERSLEAVHDVRRIRLELDRVIALAGREADFLSERIEHQTRALVVSAATLGVIYVILLAAAGWYVLRTLRHQQRAVAQTLGVLRDRNRDLEVFAGRVAHDLRGPLAPLPMAAELLERRADDPIEVRRLATRVRRSASRAHRLIESLLAFSTTGRTPDHGARADLHRCMTAAVEDQQDQIDERHIEVGLALEPVTVGIDPSLLRTVFHNLIANALRYMPDEGRRRLELRSWADEDHAIGEVEDSGIGIPAEGREAVFDPFVRRSQASGGIGLGLATVKRIVEAHGGRVHLLDAALGGLRVRVELPRAPEPRAAPAPGPQPAA